jgi:hypothetical protein
MTEKTHRLQAWADGRATCVARALGENFGYKDRYIVDDRYIK